MTKEADEILKRADQLSQESTSLEQYKEAAGLYAQAAELGSSRAAYKLAVMSSGIELGQPNPLVAKEYFEKALRAGETGAAIQLALMYEEGVFGEPDFQKAKELLEEAVTSKNADAANRLALRYKRGKIGLPDYQKSKELFESAIKWGSASASNNLALMYERGELGAHDPQTVHALFLQAVKGESLAATFNLARRYRLKRLPPPESNSALTLFLTAAERGHAGAMFNLGEMYQRGDSVDIDYQKANHWFEKADALGHSTAAQYLINPLILAFDKQLRIEKAEIDLGNQVIEALNALEAEFFARRELHTINASTTSSDLEARSELSHFTSWEALMSMLPIEASADKNQNCLRQYHVDYMNDPTEGLRLLSFEKANSDNFPQGKKTTITSKLLKQVFEENYHQLIDHCPNAAQIAPSVFIASLTRDSDRLDLWRAYGRDGDGYCITFQLPETNSEEGKRRRERSNHEAFLNATASDSGTDSEQEENCASPTLPRPPALYCIKYSDAEVYETLLALAPRLTKLENLKKRLPEKLKKATSECAAAILLELLYLYKDEQYSTENEVRALRVLKITDPSVKSDERTPGRLYIETQPFLFTTPSRIVVGPKVSQKQPALWQLRWRLNKNKLAANCQVHPSRVQYR